MTLLIIRKRAFTLLEIVVVLAIVAVLAGLIMGVFPNLLKRAHLSKCADTIRELNSAYMRGYATSVRYPDVHDSLLNGSGATLDSRLVPAAASQLTVYPLTASDVAALSQAGITRVVDLQSTSASASATYDSTPLGVTARVLSTGGNVAELNLGTHEAAGNQLGLKRHLLRAGDGSVIDNRANVRYLVFGVGPNCTAVGSGKLIQEAPVHFGASDTINPQNVYQRYLVVFSITQKPTGPEANFEAAAGNDIAGLTSSESHVRQFHEAAASEN